MSSFRVASYNFGNDTFSDNFNNETVDGMFVEHACHWVVQDSKPAFDILAVQEISQKSGREERTLEAIRDRLTAVQGRGYNLRRLWRTEYTKVQAHSFTGKKIQKEYMGFLFNYYTVGHKVGEVGQFSPAVHAQHNDRFCTRLGIDMEAQEKLSMLRDEAEETMDDDSQKKTQRDFVLLETDKIFIINVHLEPSIRRLNIFQMNLLNKILLSTRTTKPVVVAGDWNISAAGTKEMFDSIACNKALFENTMIWSIIDGKQNDTVVSRNENLDSVVVDHSTEADKIVREYLEQDDVLRECFSKFLQDYRTKFEKKYEEEFNEALLDEFDITEYGRGTVGTDAKKNLPADRKHRKDMRIAATKTMYSDHLPVVVTIDFAKSSQCCGVTTNQVRCLRTTSSEYCPSHTAKSK